MALGHFGVKIAMQLKRLEICLRMYNKCYYNLIKEKVEITVFQNVWEMREMPRQARNNGRVEMGKEMGWLLTGAFSLLYLAKFLNCFGLMKFWSHFFILPFQKNPKNYFSRSYSQDIYCLKFAYRDNQQVVTFVHRLYRNTFDSPR